MEEAQAKFTHATALVIHLWSALDIAVRNEWAGPESSNIRDWLGGVVVDMFSFPPGKTVDVEDVEEVLLQVVEDEFELRLEDDSAYQVATDIVKSYGLCLKGDFEHIKTLEDIYEKLTKQRQTKKDIHSTSQEALEEDDEADEDDNDNDGRQPIPLETSRGSNAPIVDEEGFQLVQSKRRHREK